MDFRCMQRDHARISKRPLKEKKLLWQLKAGKMKRSIQKPINSTQKRSGRHEEG